MAVSSPDIEEEFPPYDGSMDIGIWKAKRALDQKRSLAMKAKALQYKDAAGKPLYVLTGGGNLRRTNQLTAAVKAHVIERDGNKCVWCGSSGPFEIDHIQRYVDGGSNSPDNLQTLCESCHRSKGGR